MKKLFFALLSLLIISGLNAQEDPAKALKKATRALGAYNLDPSGNSAKLAEAMDYIEISFSDAEMKGDINTWLRRGEIYNALAQKDGNNMVLNPDYIPESPDAGIKAAESFIKAFEMAQKKYNKKDALKGLSEAGRHLNLIGNYQVQSEDYEGGFHSFDKVLELHTILSANGEDSPLANDEVENQKYITAYCANSSGNTKRAKELFKDLVDSGSKEAGVYSQYFNILNAEGDENAIKVIEKGKEASPNSPELLFAEINYYIGQNRFDVLEQKLKQAIEQEPDNPSVRTALGNVYMNLYEEGYSKDGDTEEVKAHFNNAIDYFNQALELDGKSFDAQYSIGSMYFNKAVEVYKKMTDLTMSKEDQKKYEVLKKEADGLMTTSLPYFKKSESINPNDVNTIVALTEVFARTNDFETSGIFKKRLEVLKAGGSHETSHFKE